MDNVGITIPAAAHLKLQGPWMPEGERARESERERASERARERERERERERDLNLKALDVCV